MRRAFQGFALVIVGLTILSVLCAARGWQSESALPGTLPRIDASRYPSIQAALDALPGNGGVVSLPPGEFEINEPLFAIRS